MPERTPNQPASEPGLSSPPRDPKAANRTPIPKSTNRPSTAAFIKSLVRKNLLASPMFPKLYADVVISSAPNSHEAKILARNYEKIVAYTERTSKPMSTPKSCTHIKVSGVRCGSPALRGEQFCYFHQRMLRTVRYPSSRVHHAALLEDEESIQASLVETVNALLRGTIDLKRAELILRALNTAVRNIRRVNFGLHADRMVKEVPDYPIPPLEQVDEGYAAELRRREERKEFNRTRTSPQPAAAPPEPAPLPARSCGDGSSARSGGPEVPGRSAPPPKPDQTQSAPPRKPPLSVKESPASAKTKALNEHPIAARRAGGG